MKINYILSDTTRYATTLALKEVTKRAECNLFDDFIVLVPETKSIAVERELLSLGKNGAFANVYVYSFVRLLSRMGLNPSHKIVSKQTCIMIIKKIINENLDRLSCYKKTAKSVGFAEKIYDTIAQFKSSEVSPEDLKSVMLTASRSLSLKLSDIVFLFEEYQKVLENKFYDDCDKLNLLKNFATTSEMLKKAEVFVVGFDNITTEMASVLKEFAKNAKEITFSCCYFDQNREDKHIQNNELYNRFKHIADSLKYPYVPYAPKTPAKGDFYAIKNYLFSIKKHKAEQKGELAVFEAKSKKQEIEYVASKIIDEVKAGKRYRDIAVLAPMLSEEAGIFEKTFDSFGIPFYMKKEYDALSLPLTKLISDCFELISSHLAAEKVLKFLANAYVSVDGYAEFENFVNETGINYGLFVKDIEINVPNAGKKQKIQNCLNFIKKFNAEFSKKLNDKLEVSKLTEIVRFVLDRFSAEKKTEEFACVLDESGLKEEAEVYRKVYKKILELLDTLDTFMGSVVVSADEFLQIFLSGFSAVNINLTPMSADCVLIQNSIDGFFGVKDLFIVGANEGNFPAKLVDSGIVLDTELEEAKMLTGKVIEPTIKQINSRENYAVYEALLLPEEKLFVSYSLKAASGAEAKPAMLINNFVSLFGEDVVLKTFKSRALEIKGICIQRFAEHVNEYLRGDYLLTDLCKEYSKVENALSAEYLDAIFRFNNESQNFVIDEPEKIYFKNNETSISQLETYFACPYKFFATYGLRLKENKDAKLSGLDIGNIIHRIAELFMKDIAKVKALKEDEVSGFIENLTNDVFNELEIKENTNKAVAGYVRKEAVRLCKYILFEQEISSFKNNSSLNEYSFSGEKSIELSLENGKNIYIKGKIDRVDECGEYKRIIDYKTGDISSDLASAYYGKKIQLVSYLLASDKMSDQKIAGLFYFPIHSDFVKNNEKVDNLYKLQGFLIDDADVLKRMDNTVTFDNSTSTIIPLKIKTAKDLVNKNQYEISKSSQKKYFTEKEFEQLKSYTKKLSEVACEEILSGYTEPSPLAVKSDDGLKECSRCSLAGFCALKKSRFNEGRRCDEKVSIESFAKEEG